LKVKLAGQRGLSVARIEQLSELRRRWQSLNQALRVTPGERPLTAKEMRSQQIPDPCPDVLEKLENIREQRVNQTAHLILAQALGLRLREPQLPHRQRQATDAHGEYEKFRASVDFIVLENLNRYLTGQGRAKRENSRLMQWYHRAITAKLKLLAEPFGIPVLETQAAYTSRFCSLTGSVGFRAVEISLQNRDDFRWKSLREEPAATIGGDQRRVLSEERKMEIVHARNLFAQLEALKQEGKPNATLLAPQTGGPIFVTAKPVQHPLKEKSVAPAQADINAAVNIGLRAIAHPARADIHHRVRTERKNNENFTREPRRFGKAQKKIEMRGSDFMPKEKNSNLFYDADGVAEYGRARLAGTDGENEFPYATGPAIWKTVNDSDFEWRRCEEINRQRVARLAKKK
jgi:IS605 OrfB family transposase